MRLEIDTKKDSVEDIKKMIEFLSKFVSDSNSSYSNNSSNAPVNVGSGSFNMFSDNTIPDVKKDDDEKDDNDDDDKYDNSKISIIEY